MPCSSVSGSATMALRSIARCRFLNGTRNIISRGLIDRCGKARTDLERCSEARTSRSCNRSKTSPMCIFLSRSYPIDLSLCPVSKATVSTRDALCIRNDRLTVITLIALGKIFDPICRIAIVRDGHELEYGSMDKFNFRLHGADSHSVIMKEIRRGRANVPNAHLPKPTAETASICSTDTRNLADGLKQFETSAHPDISSTPADQTPSTLASSSITVNSSKFIFISSR